MVLSYPITFYYTALLFFFIINMILLLMSLNLIVISLNQPYQFSAEYDLILLGKKSVSYEIIIY